MLNIRELGILAVLREIVFERQTFASSASRRSNQLVQLLGLAGAHSLTGKPISKVI